VLILQLQSPILIAPLPEQRRNTPRHQTRLLECKTKGAGEVMADCKCVFINMIHRQGIFHRHHVCDIKVATRAVTLEFRSVSLGLEIPPSGERPQAGTLRFLRSIGRMPLFAYIVEYYRKEKKKVKGNVWESLRIERRRSRDHGAHVIWSSGAAPGARHPQKCPATFRCGRIICTLQVAVLPSPQQTLREAMPPWPSSSSNSNSTSSRSGSSRSLSPHPRCSICR
jgi:hypothetical protein